jgi:magnesium transporter
MRISEGLYQANVDNALTQNSVKLNLAMQHFSAIATCFLPLNLIAGLWGMNVVVPGMEEKTEYPFGIIIGIVLFLASCSFIYFKFRRWV